MSCCYCLPKPYCLQPEDQLFLEGCTEKEVVNGPGTRCVGPFRSGGKRSHIFLKKTQWCRVKNQLTGEQKVHTGEQGGVVKLEAYDELVVGPTEAENLKTVDYLVIMNESDSVRRIEKGVMLFYPGDWDIIEDRKKAIPLKHNEYIKILDEKSGEITVYKGEDLVFLEPTQTQMSSKPQKAINVDEHHAVLVRNTKDGSLYLVTEKKLFFPKATEEVEAIRDKIVLEDHQVVVIIDRNGRYIFKEGRAPANIYADEEGSDEEEVDGKLVKKTRAKKKLTKEEENMMKQLKDRAFFLPPYCELVELEWYTSPDLTHKKERVSKFDLRPVFMTYEFTCRTCDNVELVIDLTFFWEIDDVRLMLHKTDDLPADICNHARSVIIQDVSQVTLETFMQDFNNVIRKAVLGKDDAFYAERGTKVHTVEVRSIHCKDPGTEAVLQEIIKETTDRLNRLQKQSSENEVKLKRMQGDIEEEKLNGELLAIRHDHHRAEALMTGEAEADQVTAFLKGVGKADVPFDTQFEMWQGLRKLEGIKTLSTTNSQMYFTPNDVNLSIETLTVPPKKSSKGGKTAVRR